MTEHEKTAEPRSRFARGELLTLDDGRGAIRTEGVYATGIEDLWEAVTDPARLARWLCEVEGEPALGATLTATFRSDWTGSLRVLACDPPRHLLLDSRAEGDAPTEMEAWLEPDGDGTRLVVEERGFVPADTAAHGAGWQAHLEDLAALVDGGAQTPWGERWRELMRG
jgi:uncharacterized protein YndB with AHSA1/START domain